VIVPRISQLADLLDSSIYDDMTTLCKMFYPDELEREMSQLRKTLGGDQTLPENAEVDEEGQEDEEEGRGRGGSRGIRANLTILCPQPLSP
jgi:hypothetical protein